jgi:PadR family transcriptional regulator, regulatory protein AphA
LTATSYAVLGLLAIKPWTTHELVQQVERSLQRMWPRASSKLYEEPKKLVAHGHATAEQEYVGRRPRTRYTITPAGREALASWVADPGAGPELEFEQLLKIHFADSGTTDDIRQNLHAALRWARERNVENLAAGRAYLAGEGDFSQRAALNLLVGRFLTDFYATVDQWAQWALTMTEDWPDDPTSAELDRVEQRRAVQIAEAIGLPEESAPSRRPPETEADSR